MAGIGRVANNTDEAMFIPAFIAPSTKYVSTLKQRAENRSVNVHNALVGVQLKTVTSIQAALYIARSANDRSDHLTSKAT